MNSSPGNLSKRQLNAITTILSCRTISEGVSRAGISRGTFYKWMQDPMFRGELDKQRKEVIALALQDIKASAGDAVKVLRGLLKAKNESIRLKASTSILDYIAKFLEIEELEARLQILEGEFENAKDKRATS